MSIYKQAKDLKLETNHHCSDLYLPVCEASTKLVKDYEFKTSVTKFVSQIDGKLWYDIPFAFEPYFERNWLK